MLIPAIELTAPTSFAVLDRALASLPSFHWLLFTSANAVDAFANRLRHLRDERSNKNLGDELDRDPDEKLEQAQDGDEQGYKLPQSVQNCRVAAIGAATAKALEKFGFRSDLVPPQAVAESLTEALLPHARQPDGTPTRFLLVRAEEARELLPEAPRAAGAEVPVAPAYRTVVPAASIALLRDLLAPSQDRAPGLLTSSPLEHSARETGPLAAITFTSASAARNLLTLAEAAAVALPASARRISIGPVTSAAMREFGLPSHAEAPEATVASLAATVMRVLAQESVTEE